MWLTHWPLGDFNSLTLVNGGWGISYEIALRWMPQDLTDEKSTLVQVMAWCRQATSHYLSQCWPRSLSPYGVTTPNELKRLRPDLEGFVVTMHKVIWETGSPIPRPLGRGNGRTVSQAWVHCDNQTWQIGLNHNYYMTFLNIPHEC